MFRPLPLPLAALVSISALCLGACKTTYGNMYSAQRNHFKPLPEKSKPADLLPPTMLSTPSMETPPPMTDPGTAPAPAMGAPEMGAPTMEAAPPLPGA